MAEQAELLALAELCYTPGNRQTYETYLRANTAFHLAVARCARNPSLEQIVISVLNQLQRPFTSGSMWGSTPVKPPGNMLEW